MSSSAPNEPTHVAADDVVLAVAGEIERIVAPVVLAFAADPFARFWVTDPALFLEHFPRVARIHAESTVEGGGVYRRGDFRGAAIWYPPGISPDGERLAPIFKAAAGAEGAARARTFLERAAVHEPDAPHWYLRIIALDPSLQRGGHGSRMMDAHRDVLDESDAPAYLEATSEASRNFYERHGFETMDEISGTGDEPRLWPMLRRPGGG